ncbi:MAG: FkbM family methyltransferase [Bacteroidetes bacterium]|nr:FkbM family methyltransferase [Bacteroidota bacterium]
MNSVVFKAAIKKIQINRLKNESLTFIGLFFYGIFFLGQEKKAICKEIVDKLHPVVYPNGMIRVGSQGDGGYVIPSDGLSVDALFSPGVGDNSDFELVFAEQGMPCFLADYSVDGPAKHHEHFHFTKRFLSDRNSDNTITMNEWLSNSNIQGDNLFLSMDIEGAEFGILEEMPETILRRFRFITLELHDLSRVRSLKGLVQVHSLLNQITKSHKVVHIHGNNFSFYFKMKKSRLANVLELTLARNDSFGGVFQRSPKGQYKSPLDLPNDSHSKDFILEI